MPLCSPCNSCSTTLPKLPSVSPTHMHGPSPYARQKTHSPRIAAGWARPTGHAQNDRWSLKLTASLILLIFHPSIDAWGSYSFVEFWHLFPNMVADGWLTCGNKKKSTKSQHTRQIFEFPTALQINCFLEMWLSDTLTLSLRAATELHYQAPSLEDQANMLHIHTTVLVPTQWDQHDI